MNETSAEWLPEPCVLLFRWNVLENILFFICKLDSHKFSPTWVVPEKQALNDLNSAQSTLGRTFSKDCRRMEYETQHFYPIW